MNTSIINNNIRYSNVPLQDSYISCISSDNYSTITNLSDEKNTDNCIKKIFRFIFFCIN
jgi:hypothetical protein